MPVDPNVTAHRAPCRPMPTRARQRPTQIGRVVIKSPYKRRTSDVQASYKEGHFFQACSEPTISFSLHLSIPKRSFFIMPPDSGHRGDRGGGGVEAGDLISPMYLYVSFVLFNVL